MKISRTCAEWQKALELMPLSGFPPDEHEAFLAHIKDCTVCTTAYEEQREVDRFVQAALMDEDILEAFIGDFIEEITPAEVGERMWRKIEKSIHEIPSKVRPSLFIGLGGTGNEVVQQAKKAMLEHDYDLPIFNYLVLDTSVSLNNACDDRQTEEYLNIGGYNPREVTEHIEEWREIASWWGNRPQIAPEQIDEGVGQRRAIGRMSFFYHFDTIRTQLQLAIQSIINADAYKITRERGFDIAEQGPVVYLVFSLCGGTGSGMFLDMAYLIRHLCAAIHVTTVAMAVLPGPHMQGVQSSQQIERLQSNGYAALGDIERLYLMAWGREPRLAGRYLWDVQYTQHFSLSSSDIPFDYIYLIDDVMSKGSQCSREKLYEKLGQALFWLSEPALSAAFWAQAERLTSKSLAGKASLPGDSTGKWQLPIYSALGISTIHFEKHIELQREIIHQSIEYLYAQESSIPSLPSYLGSGSRLLSELMRNPNITDPIPDGGLRLNPRQILESVEARNTLFANNIKEYETALQQGQTSVAWKKAKRQSLSTIKQKIDEYGDIALRTRGPIAARHGLEVILEQLHTCQDDLRKQQSEMDNLAKDLYRSYESYVEKLYERENNLLHWFDQMKQWIHYEQYKRNIEEDTKSIAHQLYRWYRASFRSLICENTISSILEPLIEDIRERKRSLSEIDAVLQGRCTDTQEITEQSRIQRTGQNDAKQVGRERARQAIRSGRVDLTALIRRVLQKTFASGWSENSTLAQTLLKSIELMAVQQCRLLQQGEYLPQHLLDDRMFTTRLNFREDADYLWNGKQPATLARAAIDIVGYGVDSQDSRQEIERSVQSLCQHLEISPTLAATPVQMEMVYIKTLHGLTSSSLHTIGKMQQAYAMIDVIRQSPYVHLNYEDHQTRPAEDSREPTLTPMHIVETWQHLAEWLARSKAELAKKLQEAILRYQVASRSQLREVIDVNDPEHPCFNLIEELREALLPEEKGDLDLQILTAFADLEALLQDQGWLRIDPAYLDRFNPTLHRVYHDEERIPVKLCRIVEVVRPGYIRHQGSIKPQIRPALVIVSTQLSEPPQRDSEARIPSKE